MRSISKLLLVCIINPHIPQDLHIPTTNCSCFSIQDQLLKLVSYSLTFNSAVKPYHSYHIALEAKNRDRSVPSRLPGYVDFGPAEPEDVGQRMEFHRNCYVGIGGVADLNLRP